MTRFEFDIMTYEEWASMFIDNMTEVETNACPVITGIEAISRYINPFLTVDECSGIVSGNAEDLFNRINYNDTVLLLHLGWNINKYGNMVHYGG